LIGARDYRLWIEIINGSDKTFIGRIEKGFDFLGYHFSPEGLSMAEKTIEKFLARAVRLYEQERREPSGSPGLDCTWNVGSGGQYQFSLARPTYREELSATGSGRS